MKIDQPWKIKGVIRHEFGRLLVTIDGSLSVDYMTEDFATKARLGGGTHIRHGIGL